jgi:hypothetical protein
MGSESTAFILLETFASVEMISKMTSFAEWVIIHIYAKVSTIIIVIVCLFGVV